MRSAADKQAMADSVLNADLALAAQVRPPDLAIADTALQSAPEPAPEMKTLSPNHETRRPDRRARQPLGRAGA